jgi:hypothetical protein
LVIFLAIGCSSILCTCPNHPSLFACICRTIFCFLITVFKSSLFRNLRVSCYTAAIFQNRSVTALSCTQRARNIPWNNYKLRSLAHPENGSGMNLLTLVRTYQTVRHNMNHYGSRTLKPYN